MANRLHLLHVDKTRCTFDLLDIRSLQLIRLVGCLCARELLLLMFIGELFCVKFTFIKPPTVPFW